ncbi:hypothetical protein [Phytoactinopolyspora halotolerans]|uniref:Uncharacterized protein n=1 Tax=Phytoactinopolyspora halotolerans TaxID=1981512 RepID=A0A6L9SBK3_9ACTN|nr:hypothetical protein [Phytoactinopolyspora halotolerans]NEE02024.1 hypothetical protein [Phytoactinopolyspora halotolerans]
MPAPRSSQRRLPAGARRLGAGLMWFAVLGGITAWAIHLVLAWGTVELACTRAETGPGGEVTVLGMSLRGFVAAVATAIPLAVAIASLIASWRFRSRQLAGEHRETAGDEPRLDRAVLMVQLGLGLNVFSVLMIAFGGLAVLWFSPCT